MLTSGHPAPMVVFSKFSLGVAKVAMVATANQRADLALTVGLDYRRGAANAVHRERVCPRRPGQESCGRGGAPGGGRQRAPHLKPAAKSVATCTAAALSRSDRSLS